MKTLPPTAAEIADQIITTYRQPFTPPGGHAYQGRIFYSDVYTRCRKNAMITSAVIARLRKADYLIES